jgi:colicin import membrane protein
MARKKVTKATSTPKVFSFATIQKMEKEFFKTPATLAKQLQQETTAIKQNQGTLKATLAKIAAQHKANKGKALSAKAKKAQKAAIKLQKSVEKELNAATKTLASVQTQQTKLAALSKYLTGFDKIWAKEVKAAAAKAKAAAAKAKAAKKAKVKAKKNAKALAAVTATTATETFMDFEEPIHNNTQYADTTEDMAS